MALPKHNDESPMRDMLIGRELEKVNKNPIREITKEEMLNRLAAYIIAFSEHNIDGYEMAALFKIYFDNC